MTLVKNWTIYIIQDDSFNSSFAVNNPRKLIKIWIYVPNLRGREGVSKQAKCLNFVCPKVPGENWAGCLFSRGSVGISHRKCEG